MPESELTSDHTGTGTRKNTCPPVNGGGFVPDGGIDSLSDGLEETQSRPVQCHLVRVL